MLGLRYTFYPTHTVKRILIIEDEPDIKDALQATLLDEGYQVETAETSELGLQAVLEVTPDLILLDVMTHSMHAAAFLERLRTLPDGQNNSKVIVLTNLDNDITRKKVQTYQIEDYLVKSEVSLDQITRRVREVLAT